MSSFKILNQGSVTCIEDPFIIKNDTGEPLSNVVLTFNLPQGTVYTSHVVYNSTGDEIGSIWVNDEVRVSYLPPGDNFLTVCVIIDDLGLYCDSNRKIGLSGSIMEEEVTLTNNSNERCLKGLVCCDIEPCFPPETETTLDGVSIVGNTITVFYTGETGIQQSASDTLPAGIVDTNTRLNNPQVQTNGDILFDIIDVVDSNNVIGNLTVPGHLPTTVSSPNSTVDINLNGVDYELEVTHTVNTDGSITLNDGTLIPTNRIVTGITVDESAAPTKNIIITFLDGTTTSGSFTDDTSSGLMPLATADQLVISDRLVQANNNTLDFYGYGTLGPAGGGIANNNLLRIGGEIPVITFIADDNIVGGSVQVGVINNSQYGFRTPDSTTSGNQIFTMQEMGPLGSNIAYYFNKINDPLNENALPTHLLTVDLLTGRISYTDLDDLSKPLAEEDQTLQANRQVLDDGNTLTFSNFGHGGVGPNTSPAFTIIGERPVVNFSALGNIASGDIRVGVLFDQGYGFMRQSGDNLFVIADGPGASANYFLNQINDPSNVDTDPTHVVNIDPLTGQVKYSDITGLRQYPYTTFNITDQWVNNNVTPVSSGFLTVPGPNIKGWTVSISPYGAHNLNGETLTVELRVDGVTVHTETVLGLPGTGFNLFAPLLNIPVSNGAVIDTVVSGITTAQIFGLTNLIQIG